MTGMGLGIGGEDFSFGVGWFGLRLWACVLGGKVERGCLCRCGGHVFGRCRRICHRASFSSIGTRERKE